MREIERHRRPQQPIEWLAERIGLVPIDATDTSPVGVQANTIQRAIDVPRVIATERQRMLRSIRHIAASIVVISIVIFEESGIRIAIRCAQIEIINRCPIDSRLSAVTACATGICHHTSRRFTRWEDRQLLVTAVNIEQRRLDREFWRRGVARAHLIVPAMFGFVARSLGGVVARSRLVEIDTQIRHHIGHHSVLEDIREDLRIESARLITL